MPFEKKQVRHERKRAQSKSHQIWKYEVNKMSLPCFDGKRDILADGIKTLSYSQKDVKSFLISTKNNFRALRPTTCHSTQ